MRTWRFSPVSHPADDLDEIATYELNYDPSTTGGKGWHHDRVRHALAVERARAAVTGVQNSAARLAPMSVALRTMRSLTRAAAGERD